MQISALEQKQTAVDSVETTQESAERASCVPVPTALYRHFDAGGELLYVGISLSPAYRLSQHRDASHWFPRVATVTIEWLPSRDEALRAERAAIQSEHPQCNIVHMRPVSARDAYLAELAEESCAELTMKVTRFQPSYSIAEAATTLGMSPASVRWAMAAGDIPYYPSAAKGVSISGWSLIAYMEALQAGAARMRPTPRREDGAFYGPPTAEWLVANHGKESTDGWMQELDARRADSTEE